jgi:hypothetical protein
MQLTARSRTPVPDEIAALVEASVSDNTRRACRSDLDHFAAWGGNPPAEPTLVASYLAAHAKTLASPRSSAASRRSRRRTWTAEGLRQVGALLYAARDAGRIVVVTGVHGHVLDEGTVQLDGGSGDRWRAGVGPSRDNEVALSGGRVLSPGGGTAILAA